MPTYLRWIAAITSGITVQFVFFIVFGAIAIGTKNTDLGGGAGLIGTLGATFATVLPALAVNDWLRTRYPVER